MKNKYTVEIQHHGATGYGSIPCSARKAADTVFKAQLKEPNMATVRLRKNGWLIACRARRLFPDGIFHNAITWNLG